MSDQAPDQKSWCIWSTHESIANEWPSVTAIVETIAAGVLDWWIAVRIAMLWPLLVRSAVRRLVLLRSEPAEDLGLKWFLQGARDETPLHDSSFVPPELHRLVSIEMGGGIWIVVTAVSML